MPLQGALRGRGNRASDPGALCVYSWPRAAGCAAGSTIFIIAAGWWPFRGDCRESGCAWTLPRPTRPARCAAAATSMSISPNGQFVSFTYNDHVLHERDPALDLRNVGVAAPYGPVTPQGQHPREYGGSHWCVLVSRTTPAPAPGSDEINRAYEEGWVG